MGLEHWHELPAASSLCGACKEACPIRIDIPKLLVDLRNQSTKHMSRGIRLGIAVYTRVATRPLMFRFVMRLGGLFGGVLGRDGWLRRIPGVLRSWSAEREVPAPARETFADWWRKREA
jgi:L-lactate dehydrogenase complex protein LldF